MSADRETRARLEQVQQRLAGIEEELALEESPGFTEQLRQLAGELELSRSRAQRGEEKLGQVQRELAAAEAIVTELELAAQAKQSNDIDDIVGAVTGAVMIGLIGGVAWLFRDHRGLPLELVASVGMACSAGLGAVLRARVVRPKKPRLP